MPCYGGNHPDILSIKLFHLKTTVSLQSVLYFHISMFEIKGKIRPTLWKLCSPAFSAGEE